jgi:hypothetical protein
MNCYKCGKPMLHTPICVECGGIPVAEPSFNRIADKVARLQLMNTKLVHNLRRIQLAYGYLLYSGGAIVGAPNGGSFDATHTAGDWVKFHLDVPINESIADCDEAERMS